MPGAGDSEPGEESSGPAPPGTSGSNGSGDPSDQSDGSTTQADDESGGSSTGEIGDGCDAGADRPIPMLELWESHMLDYAAQHCAFLAQPGTTFDQALDSVYYDQTRVMYQIAAYTGDDAWVECAIAARDVYRDQYVAPNGGSVPGYWNFTTGLRLDFEQSGDTTSRDAVVTLSENAAYAPDATPLEWTATADRSREVAYAIVSYIDAEAIGEGPRQRRIDLVDQAYAHLEQWFVDFSWPGPWQQNPQTTDRLSPFMVALTAHALIRDWEQTDDARLIPALELAADWMWEHAWIAADEAMWYESLNTSAGAPDLNLLVAPIYAFLYRETGDESYRDQADALFAGGVTHAWLDGGKQYNQNYWWSFDYVQWRQCP
jgi:hypothetical protein